MRTCLLRTKFLKNYLRLQVLSPYSIARNKFCIRKFEWTNICAKMCKRRKSQNFDCVATLDFIFKEPL